MNTAIFFDFVKRSNIFHHQAYHDVPVGIELCMVTLLGPVAQTLNRFASLQVHRAADAYPLSSSANPFTDRSVRLSLAAPLLPAH
jgi:hypothetical protein